MITNKKEVWINIVKTIAIIMVIYDHLTDITHNGRFVVLSYASVSMFVFVMGVTSYWTYEKANKGRLFQKWCSKITKLLLPYTFASLVYSILLDRSFDIINYITRLIRFNSSGPLYFVALYIQLMVISPVAFYIIYRLNKVYELCFWLCAICMASLFFSRWISVLGIYGGGGKVLGGTFLLVFFVGMLFAEMIGIPSVGQPKRNIWVHMTLFVVSVAVFIFSASQLQNGTHSKWILYLYKLYDYRNPPNLVIVIYSIALCFVIYSSCQILAISSEGLANKRYLLSEFIGQHTMYVFLYHSLIIKALKHIDLLQRMNKSIGKTVLFEALAILGSIIVEYCIVNLKRRIKEKYTHRFN